MGKSYRDNKYKDYNKKTKNKGSQRRLRLNKDTDRIEAEMRYNKGKRGYYE